MGDDTQKLRVRDDFYVTAHSSVINLTNVANQEAGVCGTYRLYDISNECPFDHASLAKPGKPQCDLCYQVLATFSALYAHKAHACYEDAVHGPPYVQAIQIGVPVDEFAYVADAIDALGFNVDRLVTEEGEYKCIVVDVSLLEITLRRLYTARVTKYNLEEWYEPLQRQAEKDEVSAGYTARSLILPLSDDELQLIRRWASITLSRNLGMPTNPTNAEEQARVELEDKITALLGEGNNQPFFCKLSTRSPKDGVSLDKDEGMTIEERLDAKFRKMQVRNGQEVFELIIKSQRIFSDIQMFFQYRVPKSTSGEMALILREWMGTLRQDMEFRCFVHERNLTAISQYHCYCRFEPLQDDAYVRRIRDAIAGFVARVKDCFPMESYVIDIAVVEDPACGDELGCLVIELNPFGKHMSGGSSLYHWVQDEPLLYGREPRADGAPHMRVLEHLEDDEEENARAT